MFFKIDVLKNFTIFTGKHLCWSLFLIKPATLLKSNSDRAGECRETFKNSSFIEHLQRLLLSLLEMEEEERVEQRSEKKFQMKE